MVGLGLVFAGIELLRDHRSTLIGELATRYGLSGLGYELG